MTRTAHVLAMLSALVAETDTVPGRHSITCLEHSLRVAHLAREDHADPELQIVALLHDIARGIAGPQHGVAAAVMFEDRLTEDRLALLGTHGVFQHDLIHGTHHADHFRDRPWYPDALRLQQWERQSFTTSDAPGLDTWEPALAQFLGEGSAPHAEQGAGPYATDDGGAC